MILLLAGEPEELKDKQDRAVTKADRRYSRHERENRFLVKRSEDYQVFDDVFDMPTMMVITGMVNDGIIKSVRSHFASGKESKVYLAVAPDGSPVALKIYLTVSAEFKKRLQYIAGDPRFSETKKGSRNLIAVWARKEFKNLQTAHQSKVRVPSPIAVQKNVLAMEFIGDSEGNAAQTLANSPDVKSTDYKQVMEQAALLYQKAGLVHADLSEYNIFKTDSGIVLFDFGSAVDIKHPNSRQFLLRDVANVNRFFEKHGVAVLDSALAVEKITGAKR